MSAPDRMGEDLAKLANEATIMCPQCGAVDWYGDGAIVRCGGAAAKIQRRTVPCNCQLPAELAEELKPLPEGPCLHRMRLFLVSHHGWGTHLELVAARSPEEAHATTRCRRPWTEGGKLQRCSVEGAHSANSGDADYTVANVELNLPEPVVLLSYENSPDSRPGD